MAHPQHHGRGLGRWLLAERLALIAAETPPTRWVTVETSPKVAPFFLSQGFETAGVWPHGYRAGGEMHVLRFDLATTTADALKQRGAAAYHSAQARAARFSALEQANDLVLLGAEAHEAEWRRVCARQVDQLFLVARQGSPPSPDARLRADEAALPNRAVELIQRLGVSASAEERQPGVPA